MLDGRVAAALIWMFAESLSAEAVEQGWSLFKGRLGESVSSDLVSIVDDPMLAGGPRCFPFDDEGVAACRRTLIDRGRLAGFLGSSGFAETIEGSVPGNARQPDATSAPPAGTEQLLRRTRRDPLAAGYAHPADRADTRYPPGEHITGEFQAGATGLVENGATAWRVICLSMAGNVIDLLHGVEGLGAEVHWSVPDEVEASFGSPDLVVRGLTIGR